MTPQTAIPSRAPSAVSTDDTVTPFEVAALDLRGRVIRLGPLVDDILSRHDYPAPVAKLLGEAIVLTIMLGSMLRSKAAAPQTLVRVALFQENEIEDHECHRICRAARESGAGFSCTVNGHQPIHDDFNIFLKSRTMWPCFFFFLGGVTVIY